MELKNQRKVTKETSRSFGLCGQVRAFRNISDASGKEKGCWWIYERLLPPCWDVGLEFLWLAGLTVRKESWVWNGGERGKPGPGDMHLCVSQRLWGFSESEGNCSTSILSSSCKFLSGHSNWGPSRSNVFRAYPNWHCRKTTTDVHTAHLWMLLKLTYTHYYTKNR